MITTSAGRARALPALVAIVVALGWYGAAGVGAAVGPFALTPTSGPPGTAVSVSGTGCSPGLTVSATSDYVAVNAPTLSVSVRIPVAANGSWHGSFTVPAGAGAMAAPVAALCVSDSLPSLTTLYTPQTFTVTAPPPATTTTTTPPTTGTAPTTATTPTTKPGGTGTTSPPAGGGGPAPDGGPSTTSPGGGTPPGSTNGGSSPAGGSTRAGATEGGGAKAERGAATVRAADLSLPELRAPRAAGGGGLGWLAWLLVLALVAAAIATPFWLRRSREPDDPTAIGDGS